ncbi:MAG: hypothetical protein A2X08_02265 [Bacteroidetes bacterium GWA2_32_17]|nr:MAG: hypothetical protein A2X08_02265 [Bacteroidetes bacterium GWA2_32_17]
MRNRAQIICIGDELLIGQVVNTNSAWLGSKLTELGFNVTKNIVISDNYNEIYNSINQLSKETDLIIVTGGLGPTNDDITINVLCDFFNSKLIRNKIVEEHIKSMFSGRNLPITELNLQQADLPNNCEVLFNELGTAPGMVFNNSNYILVSLPGVPFEMKNIFKKKLITFLKNKFNLPEIISQTIMVCGIAESFLVEKINNWEENINKQNLSLAYLPQPGIIRLRITAKQECENAEKLILNEISKLKLIIPNHIFAIGDISFEEVIGKMLFKKNKTICTAESCTGGYISHLITSVSGSSKYYKGSVIAYSNSIKTSVLKVSKENIDIYGAVSEQVVTQMAQNARNIFETDFSIAVSGIAGPDGGTAEKPVGTVWIAIASKNNVIAKKFLFGNDRIRNIIRASVSAFDMLRKQLIS